MLQVSDWTSHIDECKETRKEYVKYELEQMEAGKDIQIGNMFEPGKVRVLRSTGDGRIKGRQHFVVQVRSLQYKVLQTVYRVPNCPYPAPTL